MSPLSSEKKTKFCNNTKQQANVSIDIRTSPSPHRNLNVCLRFPLTGRYIHRGLTGFRAELGSALKMETVRFSKTFAYGQNNTRLNNPERHNILLHHRENLKSYND